MVELQHVWQNLCELWRIESLTIYDKDNTKKNHSVFLLTMIQRNKMVKEKKNGWLLFMTKSYSGGVAEVMCGQSCQNVRELMNDQATGLGTAS